MRAFSGMGLALLLLSAGWSYAAGEAEPATDATAGATKPEFTIAVFLMANQTYDEAADLLEAGVRDIVAQTIATHPKVALVDPLRLDRAIRRHGYNPRRPIPYGEAARIAKELECDRAVSGSVFQSANGMRIELQMAYIPDMTTSWIYWETVQDMAGVVDAGVMLSRLLLQALPANPDEVSPTFLTGSHLKIKLASTAERVTLALAEGETAALHLQSYRVLSGKTLATVAWDPATGVLTVATAEGTTKPDWSIELDAVLVGGEEQVRLALLGSPGARIEADIVNENLFGEPRQVKSIALETDTPRADVLVSGEAIRHGGPVYVLERPFGPAEGSLPLHTQKPEPEEATEGAATGQAAEPDLRAEPTA